MFCFDTLRLFTDSLEFIISIYNCQEIVHCLIGIIRIELKEVKELIILSYFEFIVIFAFDVKGSLDVLTTVILSLGFPALLFTY